MKHVETVSKNLTELEESLREVAVIAGKNEVTVSTLDGFKSNTRETLEKVKKDLLALQNEKLDTKEYAD